jgi:hypothetical protein
MFSNSLTQASFFGCYELSNMFLRKLYGLQDASISSVQGLCVVTVSGGFAGIISELTTHFLSEFEEIGFRKAYSRFTVQKHFSKLSIRSIGFGFIPGSLCFLALEFGKAF